VSDYQLTVQQKNINSVSVLEVIPPQIKLPKKVIVYVHGGAFVFLSAKSGISTSGPIAFELGVKVIAVDYTLAPEKKLSEMRKEIQTVFQGLLDQGVQMKDVGILADSAGATIAVGAVQEFLEGFEQDVNPFWGMVFYSPWVDLRLIDPSLEKNDSVDPILRVKDYLEVAAQLVVENPSQFYEPLNSVVLLQVHQKFPPLLIQVGEQEILLDQSVHFYNHLTRQKHPSELQIFPKMWHVFQSTHPDLKESREARQKVQKFLLSQCQRDVDN
jgi:acetyl esterase/lipase